MISKQNSINYNNLIKNIYRVKFTYYESRDMKKKKNNKFGYKNLDSINQSSYSLQRNYI